MNAFFHRVTSVVIVDIVFWAARTHRVSGSESGHSQFVEQGRLLTSHQIQKREMCRPGVGISSSLRSKASHTFLKQGGRAFIAASIV